MDKTLFEQIRVQFVAIKKLIILPDSSTERIACVGKINRYVAARPPDMNFNIFSGNNEKSTSLTALREVEGDSICAILESTKRVLEHLDMCDEFLHYLKSQHPTDACTYYLATTTLNISGAGVPPLEFEREDLFGLCFYLGGMVAEKRHFNAIFFTHGLEILMGCFDPNELYRRVCISAVNALFPSGMTNDHNDIVLDMIIQKLGQAGTPFNSVDDRIVSVMREIALSGSLDSSVAIDLVREIFRRYRPNNFPLWALEILRIFAKQMRYSVDANVRDPCDDEVLTPSQLVAKEIIDKMKFCIPDSGVSDSANFLRSIYALEIACNCLSVFQMSHTQAFIVKLCEAFEYVVVFAQPTLIAGHTEENDLRLLCSLQFVSLIVCSKEQVVSFFKSRLESSLWQIIIKRNLSRRNDRQDSSHNPTIQSRLLEELTLIANRLLEQDHPLLDSDTEISKKFKTYCEKLV